MSAAGYAIKGPDGHLYSRTFTKGYDWLLRNLPPACYDAIRANGCAGHANGSAAFELGYRLVPVRLTEIEEEAPHRVAGSAELLAEARKTLQLLLRAYEQLLPGIGKIACSDYAVVNDAPAAANALLARIDALGGGK